jgi:hypothetical protein
MRSATSPATHFVIGLVAALGAQGCAPKVVSEPVQHTVRKVTEERPEAAIENEPEVTQATPESTQKAFAEKLSGALERLDAELDELEARVAGLAEDARAEWTEKLAALNAKREKVMAKLGELGKATGEAWEHVRDGAQDAWEEFDAALKKAAAEF